MRVLYFSNEDVPGDHAGAVHTWEVARGLARRGHRVTLVSAAADGLRRRETKEGVLILRAPSRIAGAKCNLAAFPLLASPLRRKWDIVMERYLTLNGLGYLYAAASGLPYYVEVNGPHLEEITYRWGMGDSWRKRALTWWVDRQFARADGACAPNVNIVRPVARDRADKIIWGVSEEEFSGDLGRTPRALNLRKRFGGDGRFVVLFVGSFRPWQGARDLPEIISRTVRAVPEAVFWMVGDGDDRPALEAALSRTGLRDKTVFLGWRRHVELPYVMAAADVAVAPFNDSYYPPLREMGFYWAPTKVLECLASGLPVVTSRYQVLDEMVKDGETGFLVRAGDADAFAAALASLAADSERRAGMGASAERDVKERFGWNRHCALLESYLRRAWERRKRLRGWGK